MKSLSVNRLSSNSTPLTASNSNRGARLRGFLTLPEPPDAAAPAPLPDGALRFTGRVGVADGVGVAGADTAAVLLVGLGPGAGEGLGLMAGEGAVAVALAGAEVAAVGVAASVAGAAGRAKAELRPMELALNTDPALLPLPSPAADPVRLASLRLRWRSVFVIVRRVFSETAPRGHMATSCDPVEYRNRASTKERAESEEGVHTPSSSANSCIQGCRTCLYKAEAWLRGLRRAVESGGICLACAAVSASLQHDQHESSQTKETIEVKPWSVPPHAHEVMTHRKVFSHSTQCAWPSIK